MLRVKGADGASLISHGSDKYPHYVTRRYAELTACVHLLRNAESREMLDHSLNYMRNEVEGLWGRIAVHLGDERRRLVFRINQVDCVLGIYTLKGVPADVIAIFTDMLDGGESACTEKQICRAERSKSDFPCSLQLWKVT